jgi:hypothetical protein
MWSNRNSDSLEDWYSGYVKRRVKEHGAGWMREYAWDLDPIVDSGGSGYHCDPCLPTVTSVAPGGDFSAYGRDDISARLSRIRVRYTPEEANEDLILYFNNIPAEDYQLKFVNRKHDLESLFPICESGWAPNPGKCLDKGAVPSCNISGVSFPVLVLIGLGLLKRRKH